HILAHISVNRFEDIVLTAIGQGDGSVYGLDTAIRITLRFREQERPELFGQLFGYLTFIDVRSGWIISEDIFPGQESGDYVIDQVAVLVPAPCDLRDPDASSGGIGAGVVWDPDGIPIGIEHWPLQGIPDAPKDLCGINPVFPVEIVTKIEWGLISQEVLSLPHENHRVNGSHQDQRRKRKGASF